MSKRRVLPPRDEKGRYRPRRKGDMSDAEVRRANHPRSRTSRPEGAVARGLRTLETTETMTPREGPVMRLRLSQETWDALAREARRTGLSRTLLVNRIVLAGLKKRARDRKPEGESDVRS